MKRFGHILWVSIFACCAEALALSGSGTEASPYLIQNRADFDTICNNSSYWDDYIRLETDIDLSGTTYQRAPIAGNNGGGTSYPDTPFTGVFDGNGYAIRNLTIDTQGSSDWHIGLFGHVHSYAEIRNLGVEDFSIYGYRSSLAPGNVGGLCGRLNVSVIRNCYATGTISGNCERVGGLCGQNSLGTIRNCYVEGDISGRQSVGGLCGNNMGIVEKCYSGGAVVSQQGDVGGLCGQNSSAISNCYSTASVADGSWGRAGGFIGYQDGAGAIIKNCYSTGVVTGNATLGGFCGNSYSTPIQNCFWDVESSGQTVSSGGTGKTTAEMKQQSTFTGWDFPVVWFMPTTNDYPALQLPFDALFSFSIHNGSGAEGTYTQSTVIAVSANVPEPWEVFSGWITEPSEYVSNFANSSASNTTFTMPTADVVITATFSDTGTDSDGDGLIDSAEAANGTNPNNPDSDSDGFDDYFEVENGWNPIVADTFAETYVRTHGENFGLYPSNVVLDVAVGQMLINTSNSEAHLYLQLEKSDDLQSWTNAGLAVEWILPVDVSNKFFRVRAEP